MAPDLVPFEDDDDLPTCEGCGIPERVDGETYCLPCLLRGVR
jgi:hypothetical protein